MKGTAIPAAARTFWTILGPLVAAASPEELAEAAVPEAELDDVIVAEPEADADEELVPEVKLF